MLSCTIQFELYFVANPEVGFLMMRLNYTPENTAIMLSSFLKLKKGQILKKSFTDYGLKLFDQDLISYQRQDIIIM